MSETELQQRRANPERTLRSRPAVVELDRVQWREAQSGNALIFEGHAAVFDERSEVLYDMWGPFREILRPGAFAEVIAANQRGDEDTKFLGINHDRNQPLARVGNQTLELEEDDVGLLVRATLAATRYAQDLRVLLESRTVHQMSFTFTVAPDGATWRYDYDNDGDLREVTNVARLFDVSPVVYPAYPQTDAGLRALDQLRHVADQIAAGARSADPAELTALGHALRTLDGVPQDVAARARQQAAPATHDASPVATHDASREASVDTDAAPSAARARHLRLRELGVGV